MRISAAVFVLAAITAGAAAFSKNCATCPPTLIDEIRYNLQCGFVNVNMNTVFCAYETEGRANSRPLYGSCTYTDQGELVLIKGALNLKQCPAQVEVEKCKDLKLPPCPAD
ncbi:hypothetical protein FB451DRAFT_1170701 [Mycena latifolia]|nr:hypothetical protein FB451DRAFT_1170701 [Mycena latifolia]